MYTSDNIFGIKFRRSVGALCAVLSVVAASCIKNDIPYPHIQPNILAVEAEHQSRTAAIDSVERNVTLFLDEDADLQDVRLASLTLSKGATCPDTAMIVEGLNLTEPVEIKFAVYYDYVWTFSAVQSIERYFTVANQVGASQIDVENHTASAMVPSELPLDEVVVRSLKLGGGTAVMSPDLVGKTVDFTQPVKVTVTEFGREQEWTVSVTQTDVAVNIERVDAWTKVAWIYATAEEGRTVSFEYRLTGVDVWTQVPQGWVTVSGGNFNARIINLLPESTYEVRAVSGEDVTLPETFTTMNIARLPNSQFENWWLDGKIWCPWVEGENPFWGTGNKGATTLGPSNTSPIANLDSPTGYHGAKLESKFVGISILGKLAAGNLFAGDYVATEGTNGILSFGRLFSNYPTKLTGKIEYTSVPISHYSSGFQYMVGQPDTCIVWCALGDWEEPYEIRTNPAKRKLFNPEDPGVIAYGQVQFGYSTDGYVDISVNLDYRSTSRKPRYILVVASASKYGDYFTGGSGSILNIDHLELEYDY
ncbi:MAG: PCMD domain-containing protein [Paramuribaculum sp.]|nr:PCMD domain-containing protein [Paramuribaculum sp.]